MSRTRTICLGSVIFAAGSAICAGSVKSIGMLIGGRIIAGFGEVCLPEQPQLRPLLPLVNLTGLLTALVTQGLFLGTAAVYCSEISPKKRRGMMMTILQLFIATGVCAGYWTCYGATNISNSLQWRLPFVLSTALAITVAVLSLVYLPHSPRWLLLNGRRADADKVLDLIVGRDVDALNERKEMLIVPVAMTGSKRQAFLRMWQKDVRWRSILGASIQALQMMSGIDFVLFCERYSLQSSASCADSALDRCDDPLPPSGLDRRQRFVPWRRCHWHLCSCVRGACCHSCSKFSMLTSCRAGEPSQPSSTSTVSDAAPSSSQVVPASPPLCSSSARCTRRTRSTRRRVASGQ